MRRALLLALLTVLALTSIALADLKVKKVERQQTPSFVGYVQDEIVVKFEPSEIAQFNVQDLRRGRFGVFDLDQLATKYEALKVRQQFPGARVKYYRGRQIDLAGWYKVKFAKKVNIKAVLADFRNSSGVIQAQPIGIHAVSAIPNDDHFSDQWHLNQDNDHDIDAPEAWDIETGNQDIIVAILDTGVRYFHKDLGGANASYDDPTNVNGNMWINWAEKNGTDGVDDDGNGYVDDWIGWDFVDGIDNPYPGEDGDTPDNDPRDFNGHGTHCAGNVGAINNNGYATASPSGGWGNGSLQVDGNGVKVMACRIGWSEKIFRFFEVGYVRMDFAAEAFYYAADNGARIASCSWGSSNDGGIADAIDYFLANGGLIFKAAGNDGNEQTDYMTARDDIISVAATDENDVKADFSSYGTWVDISAPGVNIYSLYHDHTDPENDYVASMDGTSMATPLAASVAALIWSQHPDWSASQVEQRLYDSADDIYGISGNSSYQGKLGAGRINAFNAVNTGGPTPPTAAFSASPTSGCAPLNVTFTDESTGDIDSWSWDFGDGGTSTAQNPTHQYTAAGTYTVSLTVTGPGGSDTETKTDYISVSTAPTAAFTGSPTSGDAPLTVSFTDQSTGDPTSWSWDFGDGGTSTAQNPTHEYTAAGTYTVSLTATNDCGSDTETKVDYITVTEPQCDPPVADFVGDPTSGDAPLTVSFTDQSTNNPTSWSWDFGDGATSTAQNPTHEYTTAGTYTVSLTATNSCGSDTETKVDYITVTEPQCDPPIADFVGDPTSGDAPLTVSFTDQSTNNPTSWSWDFGDGATSTAQNPTHEYSSAGTYTVSLTATNSCGSDTETKVDYITVTEPVQNVMHVDAIEVTKQSFFIVTRGKARVRIVDANGSPVQSATVRGDWSGGASDSDEFTTDSDGWGETYSNWTLGDADFTFCVTDVSKSGWTYDPAANVATCGSSDGTTTTTTLTNVSTADLEAIEKEVGQKFIYNSPNPFNPTTSISFLLPKSAYVKLEIYNVLGKRIVTLMDGEAKAGLHSVTWNAQDEFGHSVSSGNYFYVITIDHKQTIKRKMLLLK